MTIFAPFSLGGLSFVRLYLMGFNWIEIKEKYPKAFNVLLEGEDLDSNSTFGMYDPETDWEYNIRQLYTFFDEHNLECFIIPGEAAYEKVPFIFGHYKGEKYLNREEAEEELFTRAFGILETKLNEHDPVNG